MKRKGIATIVSVWIAAHACVAAAGGSATVPGVSNPNLAARADAYACCSGDSAPQHAPALVSDLELVACSVLRFSVSGKVSYVGEAVVGDNPDGHFAIHMSDYGDGIAGALSIRMDSMVGVFLTDDSPAGDPEQLNFADGLDFASVSPGIGQVFYIGDGRSSDTNAGQFDGPLQWFIVPVNATRLFLGTGDQYGWYNNSGAFDVEVTSTPPPVCGDLRTPTGINASDSLYVLRSAVGTENCAPCGCDVDSSGAIVATDSLIVLRIAVGLDLELNCPPCC